MLTCSCGDRVTPLSKAVPEAYQALEPATDSQASIFTGQRPKAPALDNRAAFCIGNRRSQAHRVLRQRFSEQTPFDGLVATILTYSALCGPKARKTCAPSR